jgi:hypothetical protein
MILKIKREDVSQQWWILDNIAKIGVGHSLRMTRESLEELIKKADYEIVLMDNMFKSASFADAKDIIKDDLLNCMVLICRKTDGEEFSVLFDTVAYLCNDEGKTIEKISVD